MIVKNHTEDRYLTRKRVHAVLKIFYIKFLLLLLIHVIVDITF